MQENGCAHLSYQDFDLDIGTGSGRDYAVAVLHSPAGETRGKMRLLFDEVELAVRLRSL